MTYRSTHIARRTLHELASQQGGYFTDKQARSAGYSKQHVDYHVNARNFERVEYGLYRLPEIPLHEHDDLIRLSLWSRERGITPSTITACLAAGLSRSPDFQLHYGIELQDYFYELLRRDYSVEPPSNRTSHSRGIRLYGSWAMTAGEARPLSPDGESRFTGRPTPILKRQIRGSRS